jgi:hypothetical protein
MSYLKVIESRFKAADPDNDGTLDERNYDRVPPININGNTMQIGVFCLLVFVASTVASANEFGSLPEVKEITNGQPADVAAFIERVVECNHWGGEEPYDKERAEQIRKAVEKARCDTLDSDEQALEQTYKGTKKVLEAIAKAKRLVM